MKLLLYDRIDSEHLAEARRLIAEQLATLGVEAAWSDELPDQSIPRDTAVLAHSSSKPGYEITDNVFLGKRLTNRLQRLEILRANDIPVAEYAAPATHEALQELFERWDTDAVIYKSDSSFRRKGVRLVRPGDRVELDPTRDVVMRVLEGDPSTYKVATFYDSVIACRRLYTRSLFDPRFHDALSPQEVLPVDDELEAVARRISLVMHRYGAGYMSIDFMRHRGRWLPIEVNPCGVGRRTSWRWWPRLYADGYVRGVSSWLAAGRPDTLRQMLARAQRFWTN